MAFGSDKCAYMFIHNGKRKVRGETIKMNGLELQELEIDESYKYLGQDEDISFKGDLNKERVVKEYRVIQNLRPPLEQPLQDFAKI